MISLTFTEEDTSSVSRIQPVCFRLLSRGFDERQKNKGRMEFFTPTRAESMISPEGEGTKIQGKNTQNNARMEFFTPTGKEGLPGLASGGSLPPPHGLKNCSKKQKSQQKL
jgi:hypothetical protein